MSQFKEFAEVVEKGFKQLNKQATLFVASVDGQALYERYIASFPEGTNPMFRERTEHDCMQCRRFIKNVGAVVAINSDLTVTTVWSVSTLEEPYATVAKEMDEYIQSLAITELFRIGPKAANFVAKNVEHSAEGTYTWHHFHGTIDPKFITQSNEDIGDFNTARTMLKNSFEVLTIDSLTTVIDLIGDKQLYRGEEYLERVVKYKEALEKYNSLNSRDKELFLTLMATKPSVARFINSVIGTLIEDLDSGDDITEAVNKYGVKVDPRNFQRTNQVVTQKMVDAAIETINKLGVPVQRRMATLSDISVNNVLWVDNGVRPQMKHGLSAILAGAVTQKPVTVKAGQAMDIDIKDFIAKVLPNAQGMRLLMEGNLSNSLMTLTTADEEGSAPLFKWDNPFAWAYSGNITDSDIRRKVQERGGRVDGVLRFTHSWNYDKRNASLMDLHVFMPGSSAHSDGQHDKYPTGQRVGWNQRNDSKSGGVQDVDYVSEAPANYVPVENITFPDMDKLKEGVYTFKVHNWKFRNPTQGGFRAEIEFGGQLFQYEYDKPLQNKEWVTVATATLKDGVFTIEHKLSPTTIGGKKWGLEYGQYTDVASVMYSPNHWDGKAVGNLHYFFILKDAKTDEEPRSMFNEYLHPDLHKHRKVFDVIGERTKAPITDQQLSGVGISSTLRDKYVFMEVNTGDARLTYKINF